VSSGGVAAEPDAGADAVAIQDFTDNVLPSLTTVGCVACHALESNGAFLAGDSPEEIRNTLLAYSPAVVNPDAPSSSRLLTKGTHSGPAFGSEDSATVLRWIELESKLIPEGEGVVVGQTAPFMPQFCTAGEPGDETCPINSIPLDELGVAGAAVTFTAEQLSAGLYLSEINVVGGTGGVYVEHPLFLYWPEENVKEFDEFDRFFAAKINVEPAGASRLEGGAAVFVQFDPSKPISVAFQVIEAYRPEGGGGGGGCKDLQGFSDNAAGPLNNNCVSCHGGSNANATNAMNLSGLVGNADVQTACNETLLKSNKDDPPTSSIFVSTDPNQGAAHPFKFNGNAGNHAAFEASVTNWINLEKTAP
jgi:mono/diheme cytochrome c family protein